MFSGIGGFEYGIGTVGECVGFSEIDKKAINIYKRHFPDHHNFGDASKIDERTLPDFDLLVGGFPCQAFSVAGKRLGFQDTRGTLFFEIARILSHKRPRNFLLENVKGLLSHDEGKTFATILGVLTDMGYRVEWEVLNSKDYGVPQNRERVFIVGHLGNGRSGKVFPLREDDFVSDGTSNAEEPRSQAEISHCLRSSPTAESDDVYIAVGTLRTHKDGEGFRQMSDGMSPTIPARAREDGSGQPIVAIPVLTPDRPEKKEDGVFDGCRIRRLTPVECERLQGFPDDWTKYGADGKVMSDSSRYKACGNAVTTNVITAIISKLFADEILLGDL